MNRYFWAAAAELILSAVSPAGDFKIESNLPPGYQVTNKVPVEQRPACSYCADCKCAPNACPGKCPVAAAPAGYPPAPAGFRWAKYPSGQWGLIESHLSDSVLAGASPAAPQPQRFTLQRACTGSGCSWVRVPSP